MNEKLGAAALTVGAVVLFVAAGTFTILGNAVMALTVLVLAASALLTGTAGGDDRAV
jgi:hypothetical protein